MEPEPRTLRELTAAADLKSERDFRYQWQHTLALAAQIYNANRPANRPAIDINKFNPFRGPAAKPAPPTKQQLELLSKMFPYKEKKERS